MNRQASHLLIDEEPLQLLPKLACAVGVNGAIVLQQLHYWLRRSKNVRDGKRWVYNNYEEWHEQFPFWDERTIQRIFIKLKKDGWIFTEQFEKSQWNRRKWYSINYEKLNAFWEHLSRSSESGTIHDDNMAPSMTTGGVDQTRQPESNIHENTTEITHENTTHDPAADGVGEPPVVSSAIPHTLQASIVHLNPAFVSADPAEATHDQSAQTTARGKGGKRSALQHAIHTAWLRLAAEQQQRGEKVPDLPPKGDTRGWNNFWGYVVTTEAIIQPFEWPIEQVGPLLTECYRWMLAKDTNGFWVGEPFKLKSLNAKLSAWYREVKLPALARTAQAAQAQTVNHDAAAHVQNVARHNQTIANDTRRKRRVSPLAELTQE